MAKKTVNKEEENLTQPEIKQVRVKLTQEQKIWADYLKRIQITPEEFLKRYPNHPFKSIIEKLKK